jgi:hypothetical protein
LSDVFGRIRTVANFFNGTHDDNLLDFVIPFLDKPVSPYEEIWVLSTIWNEMGSQLWDNPLDEGVRYMICAHFITFL